MYTLYIANKNYSSWSLRPWLLMRSLDIAFEEILLPFNEGSNWHRFREFSPNGCVPCLHVNDDQEENDTAVWDSLAIVEYLAEHHSAVWPDDVEARIWARCAAAEMHAGFMGLRSYCPMNCAVRVLLSRVSDSVQRDVGRLDELWSEGLRRFGGPFLAGQHFTAVDAFYAPVVFRVRSYDLQMSEVSQAYVAHMLAQEAMLDWNDQAVKEPWLEKSHEEEIQQVGTVLEDYRL